jgi:nicotinamidase-related amidase
MGHIEGSAMLLDASRSHLFIVDAQERLMPALETPDRVLHNGTVLLRAASCLGVPVTVTEQYPQGLGSTVQAIRAALPDAAVTLPKLRFAAGAEPAIGERVSALRAEGRDQVVIAGAEAHVCVLQTALGLRLSGYDVSVVGDAVSSRSLHNVSAACARLLHAGCHWVTTEMVVFEWLARSDTEAFRRLLPLVKDPAPNPPSAASTRSA